MPAKYVDPFSLPPKEAIAYLRSKLKLLGIAPNFPEVSGEINNYAFYVSGVDRAHLLNRLYELVERFLVDPEFTYRDFETQFVDAANVSGWVPSDGITDRARIVAQTNLDTAQAAAQYRSMNSPQMKRALPYARVSKSFSRNPRPHHKVLEGRVFRTEEILRTPEMCFPCGFGCRHKLQFLRRIPNDLSVEDIPRTPDGRVAVEVEIDGVVQYRNVADKGWDYIPGIPNIGNISALTKDVDPINPQQS
jgi:hypothetical protein